MNENNPVNTTQQEDEYSSNVISHEGNADRNTQEEVNNIVRERTAALDKREAEIQAREAEMQRKESRAACAEICKEKGAKESILDLLDTSDPEKFGKLLDELTDYGEALYNEKMKKLGIPKFMNRTGNHGSAEVFDPFKPKKGLF